MGFWKKKEKSSDSPSVSSGSTNPFDSDISSVAPSYTSAPSNDYPPSYNSAPSSQGGRYGMRRNDSEYESEQRNQLLGNQAQRQQPPSQRYGNYEDDDRYGNGGGYRGASRYADEEDEEVGALKNQIRNVKQDTLESTRNALRKLAETEESAATSMGMLQEQSGQIANVGRNLDLSKAYSDRAATQASELKQLNRSIFIPVVKNPFNRSKREKRELEALQRDQQEHMAERDRIRQYEYESNARMDEARRANDRIATTGSSRRGRSESDRNRYQFEADSEDDQVEDEIDTNLDLIGNAASRLKNMAITMNQEISVQNTQLDVLNKKVDPLTERLAQTTHKLNTTR